MFAKISKTCLIGQTPIISFKNKISILNIQFDDTSWPQEDQSKQEDSDQDIKVGVPLPDDTPCLPCQVQSVQTQTLRYLGTRWPQRDQTSLAHSHQDINQSSCNLKCWFFIAHLLWLRKYISKSNSMRISSLQPGLYSPVSTARSLRPGLYGLVSMAWYLRPGLYSLVSPGLLRGSLTPRLFPRLARSKVSYRTCSKILRD